MSAERINALAALGAIETACYSTGLKATAGEARAVSTAVAQLIADLKQIQRRAGGHPDDNDADRKRDLYHVKLIADAALARMGEGA